MPRFILVGLLMVGVASQEASPGDGGTLAGDDNGAESTPDANDDESSY